MHNCHVEHCGDGLKTSSTFYSIEIHLTDKTKKKEKILFTFDFAKLEEEST